MADIFDVVADSTRREMLQILLENLVADSGEMSVSELVARTGLSQPTVSKQLKVLREAPASHFVGAPAILQKIDRPELLLRTLQSAQLRSTVITQRVMPTFNATVGKLGVHIGQMLVRQTQAIAVRAEAVQRLDRPGIPGAKQLKGQIRRFKHNLRLGQYRFDTMPVNSQEVAITPMSGSR